MMSGETALWIASIGQYAVKAIVALVAIMNPLYVLPAFLSVTVDYSYDERQRLAWRSIRYAFILLILFLAAGEVILLVFGISIGAFQLGGGILILLIGIRMFFAPTAALEGQEESLAKAEHQKQDIALTPMAIPIIAGPGTITTVLGLKSAAPGWAHQCAVAIGILVACSIVYLVFKYHRVVLTRLGEFGLSAISKLMSIMLIAVAVQISASGVRELVATLTGSGP